MGKELMNEAERYLLTRWEDARLLEEAMEEVRTKYKEIFLRVIDAVTERHPELNARVAYPTQFWDDGEIGFGRKTWPGGESDWPSGLWLWSLRLEVLAANDYEPPSASIWIPKRHKSKLDYDAARVAINAAAKEVLTTEEWDDTESEDSGEHLIWLPAPSRGKILNALSDDDGQAFVELFVSQFDMMARFVPVLDKVFR
ncbi:MAG TPA: hypothetical protein VGZ47_05365, partial [Gemmataceae bacterium]|nr:hypothetical protein [Gemmataceae bacterium]